MANAAISSILTLITTIVSGIVDRPPKEDASDEDKTALSKVKGMVSAIGNLPEFTSTLAGMYDNGSFVVDASGIEAVAESYGNAKQLEAIKNAAQSGDMEKIQEAQAKFGLVYVRKMSAQMIEVATAIADDHANGRQRAWQAVENTFIKAFNTTTQTYVLAETAATEYAAVYGSDSWGLALRLVSEETEIEGGKKVTNLVPKLVPVTFEDAHTVKVGRKATGGTGGGRRGVPITVNFNDGTTREFPSASAAGKELAKFEGSANANAIASKIGNADKSVKSVKRGDEQLWIRS